MSSILFLDGFLNLLCFAQQVDRFWVTQQTSQFDWQAATNSHDRVTNDSRDGRFRRTDHPRVLPLPLVHSFRCTLNDSCLAQVPQLNFGAGGA
jgi:hypothetical protein